MLRTTSAHSPAYIPPKPVIGKKRRRARPLRLPDAREHLGIAAEPGQRADGARREEEAVAVATGPPGRELCSQLDRDGDGKKVLRFSKRSVKKATVTFANASRRYHCWQQKLTYSCQGTPKDQGKRFAWKVRVFKR